MRGDEAFGCAELAGLGDIRRGENAHQHWPRRLPAVTPAVTSQTRHHGVCLPPDVCMESCLETDCTRAQF